MTSQHLLQQFGPRESMDYAVVIGGGGPAGLATAIRVKQLDPDASVVVLEKGSEPGAHILSGAVMDPRALTELLPDWKQLGAPLLQPVKLGGIPAMGLLGGGSGVGGERKGRGVWWIALLGTAGTLLLGLYGMVARRRG